MIELIEFEHFLPFRQRVVLPLANQGLIAIRGRNMVSAACDANGVGKTSIAHAICYGLFGEDLRGRKADAVACRFTTAQCRVHVVLRDDIGEWTITRTRRPNSLTVTGIPGVLENEDSAVLQQKIEQRLGFGLRTFKNAGVFGQGNFDRFAKADQAEAMRMLDEIQGIDFREPLQAAKDWRVDLTGKLDEQTRFLDTLDTEQIEKRLSDLRFARDDFETEKTSRLRSLSNARKDAVVSRDAVQSEIEQADVEDRAMLDALRKVSTALDDASLRENAAIEAADNARAFEATTVAEEQYLLDRLNDLVDAGTCPTCRRGVKAKTDLTKVRKLFEPELTKLSGAKLQAQAKALKAEAASAKAVLAAQAAQEARDALVPEGEDARSLIARLEHSTGPREAARRAQLLALRQADIERHADDIEALIRSTWNGASALESAERELAACTDAARKAEKRIAKIESMIAVADYWVEAFGDRGIRSLMVDGVADYVNDRVRQHLGVLAAGEATMLMSSQTDLKKGGSKEKISWTPTWAWGGASKDDGSGGQDRRMDLAVFGAVQDLAENRSARPFPLKIWDQPEADLDARGKELFCQWVAQQARERGTGILITHDKEIADSVTPDRTWTVVLTDDGAHVETE